MPESTLSDGDPQDMGQRPTFVHLPHVCIIESPSPEDLLDNRREGLALSEALSLARIRNAYYAVANRPALRQAFKRVEEFATPRTATSAGPEQRRLLLLPKLFLHFSCHGNEDGISLTNGDFTSWEELGGMLFELGRATFMFDLSISPVCMIGVTMSTCCGFHATKMARDSKACPFIFVVGSAKAVTWSDSLTAFITFYHHTLHKERNLQRSIRSMNEAAMVLDVFQIATAADVGTEGVKPAKRVSNCLPSPN